MADATQFLLMNQNTIVLKFQVYTDEYEDTYAEQIGEPMSFLPVGFEDIRSFLEKRRVPKHREHMQRLLHLSGCDRLKRFLTATKALSLNDTFWVKEVGSPLLWEDVSLYGNRFNDVIAKFAILGNEPSQEMSSTSPEFTTDGSYAKCWIRKNKTIQLLKTGSSQYGIEPFCEYYASQLARQFCTHSVSYDLEYYHNRIVSSCELFSSEKVGFIPAARVLDRKRINDIAYLLNYFETLGEGDAFRRMIVLDALLINVDRHAYNYGFQVDNNTQEIIGMAPVFDHNRSLMYPVKELTKESLCNYLKVVTPRIGTDFNTIAHKMLTPIMKSDLLNLRFFEFKDSTQIPYEDNRVSILNEFLYNQIHNILRRKDLYHYHHDSIDAQRKSKSSEDLII